MSDVQKFDVEEKLYAALSVNDMPLPYLFVGSGLSRRYLGLPNWEGLLRHFLKVSGMHEHSEIIKSEKNFPALASKIADKFIDIAFEDEQFKHLEDNFKKASGPEEVLKIAISDYLTNLSSASSGDDKRLDEECQLMKKCKLDGIITTNYDTLLEDTFPEYPRFVGQDDLLLGQAQFLGEIYKIHGSTDKPESIVITKNDYDNINQKSPYLIAKLLTIFAEHPIIFVGYSMNDKYIVDIITQLVHAVGEDATKKLTNHFYVVEYKPNCDIPTMEESPISIDDRLLPRTLIKTAYFDWLWRVLGRLERPLPTQVLRHFREQIYHLVHSNKPLDEKPIQVISFDGSESKDIKYVYGIGEFTQNEVDQINDMARPNRNSFGDVLTKDLVYRDIMDLADENLNSEWVIKTGIPEHIHPEISEWFPFHKYYKEYSTSERFEGLNCLSSEINRMAARGFLVSDNVRKVYENFKSECVGTFGIQSILDSGRADSFKLNSVAVYLFDNDVSDADLKMVREVLVSYYNSDVLNGAMASLWRKALYAYSMKKWEIEIS